MRDYMKTIKGFLIALGAFITVLIFACLLVIVLRNSNWKKRTTPLPRDRVSTLCANFQLPKDHPLCNGKKDVYGPDFYDILRDEFRSYEYEIARNEAATYEDVEDKIGEFKYECDAVVDQADGFSYFMCSYDFRGDRDFVIGIMFTPPDNAVFRVLTPMGKDGE
jgi:hypothetical protein